MARLHIDAQAATLIGYRGFALAADGHAAPEHGILKAFTSEAERELDLVAVEALGADGIDQGIPGRPVIRDGSWADQYLRAFSGTIAGGTSEIQRNIIAERILGLPGPEDGRRQRAAGPRWRTARGSPGWRSR